MRINQSDIAQAANVSIATVCRVLKGNTHIGDETRLRVLRLAAELGYCTTRYRRTGEPLSIHVLFVRLNQFPPSDAFFGEVLHGIMEEAALGGCNVRYSEIADTPDGLNVVAGHDCLVVAGLPLSDDFVRLIHSLTVPTVFIGRHQRHTSSNAVLTDNLGGAELATRHLLDCGSRRLAFLSPNPKDPVYGDRLAGFQRALTEYGYSSSGHWHAEPTALAGEHAIAEILDSHGIGGKTDGIFVAHDLMAVGALRGLDRAGVSVPNDMQIIGYSDVSAAEAAHLTTVHVPRRRLGRHAARLAAHLACGEAEAPIHWTLPPSLVVRDTTRPPEAVS